MKSQITSLICDCRGRFVLLFAALLGVGCDSLEYSTVEPLPAPLEPENSIPAFLDIKVDRYVSIKYEVDVPYEIVVDVKDYLQREIPDAQYTIEGFPAEAVRDEGGGYWSIQREGSATFRACAVDLNVDDERVCNQTTVIADSTLPQLRVHFPQPGDQLAVNSYARPDGTMVPGYRKLVVVGEVFDERQTPNVYVNGFPAVVSEELNENGWHDFSVEVPTEYGVTHLVVEAIEVPLISTEVTTQQLDVLWVPSYFQGERRNNGEMDRLAFDIENAIVLKVSQNFFDDKRRFVVRDEEPFEGAGGDDSQLGIAGSGGQGGFDGAAGFGGIVEESAPLFSCVGEEDNAPRELGQVNEEGTGGADESYVEYRDARIGSGQVFATDVMDVLNYLVGKIDIDLLIEDLIVGFGDDLQAERHPRMPQGRIRAEEDETLVYEYFLGRNGPPQDGMEGDEEPMGEPEGALIKLFVREIFLQKPEFEFDIVGRNGSNNLDHGTGLSVNVRIGDIRLSGRVSVEGIGDNVVIPEGLPGDIELPWDLSTTISIPGVGATAYLNIPEIDERGVDIGFRFDEDSLLVELPRDSISTDNPTINSFIDLAYHEFGLKGELQSLVNNYVNILLQENLNSLFEGDLNQTFTSSIQYESCMIETAFHEDTRFKAFVDGGLSSLRISHANYLLATMYAQFGTDSTSRLGWGEGVPLFSLRQQNESINHLPDVISNGSGTIQVALRTELLNGLLYSAWNAGLLNIKIGDNVIPAEYANLVEEIELKAMLPPLFRSPRYGEFANSFGRDVDLVLSVGQFELLLKLPSEAEATRIAFSFDIGMWASLNSNRLNFGITENLNMNVWDLENRTDLINAGFVGSLVQNLVWPQVISVVNEISQFDLPLPSLSLNPLIEQYNEIGLYTPDLENREFWLEVDLPRGIVISDSFDYFVLDILPKLRTRTFEEEP